MDSRRVELILFF